MAQAHILIGTESDQSHLTIRHIGPADLKDALVKGWDDFCAMPSHALFLCVMYPIIGIAIAGFTLGYSFLPLLYPLAAGFALIGPIAAMGLYELSRRREAGVEVSATRRARRLPLALHRRHRRDRRSADADVPDLDRDRECDLCGEFRLRGARRRSGNSPATC